jgi:hypothetical protein
LDPQWKASQPVLEAIGKSIASVIPDTGDACGGHSLEVKLFPFVPRFFLAHRASRQVDLRPRNIPPPYFPGLLLALPPVANFAGTAGEP